MGLCVSCLFYFSRKKKTSKKNEMREKIAVNGLFSDNMMYNYKNMLYN